MVQLDIEAEVRAALRALAPEIKAAVADAVREALADRLVTVAEAAQLTGRTPAALRKAIARGHIKVKRVGSTVRIRLSDLMPKPGDPPASGP